MADQQGVDMADDTDTTHPGETEAAAAICWDRRFDSVEQPLVQAIIAAVYPVIAAAVREQAAQDIEREAEREKDHFPPRWPGDTFWEGVTSGKRRVAGIVRGGR